MGDAHARAASGPALDDACRAHWGAVGCGLLGCGVISAGMLWREIRSSSGVSSLVETGSAQLGPQKISFKPN